MTSHAGVDVLLLAIKTAVLWSFFFLISKVNVIQESGFANKQTEAHSSLH